MGLRDHALMVEEAGMTLHLTRIATASQFWYKVTVPVGDVNLSAGTIDYKGVFHYADTDLGRKLKNDSRFFKVLGRAQELIEIDKIQLI